MTPSSTVETRGWTRVDQVETLPGVVYRNVDSETRALADRPLRKRRTGVPIRARRRSRVDFRWPTVRPPLSSRCAERWTSRMRRRGFGDAVRFLDGAGGAAALSVRARVGQQRHALTTLTLLAGWTSSQCAI